MKFIQTLSFAKSLNPFKHNFGWVAPEYHLMSWTLSCLQLRHIYKKVDLFASSNAAKLLIDTLQLPYNNCYVTHDNLHMADQNLWALPKIHTYSLQNEPFLHLDGDVFLFDKLPKSLLKNELIAQNTEEATEYYLSTQKELMAQFTYFPACIKKDFDSIVPIKAVNAGIIGGSNISFIKEYAHLAFQYVNRNAENLTKINVDHFNVFFEQHLFHSLAQEKEISIAFLFEDTMLDNGYQYLGDFHEVPCKKNYLHLLGHYKRDEYTCIQMAAKLRQLYPEYYYKIISLCKRNKLPLSINLYKEKKINTVKDYLKFKEKAKKNYAEPSYKMKLAVIEDNFISAVSSTEISELEMLKEIVVEAKQESYNITERNQMENDFSNFSEGLLEVLKHNKRFSQDYLYGRDLESTIWFCELFENEMEVINKMILRCDEINIIKSEFDWAGLVNKNKRIGVRYYEDLELSPGQFNNLIVPEIYRNGFSLHDLDEAEKLILEHLCKPMSIKTLLCVMQDYADEDVIENHLDEYNKLIIILIKQLVIKKAIKPFKNQTAK